MIKGLRKFLFAFTLLLCCAMQVLAQDTFIKSLDRLNTGNSIKVVPTIDNGWAIFSFSDLTLYKFNNCGELQWGQDYATTNTVYTSNDFINTQNGGFAVLLRMQNSNIVYSSMVLNLDNLGNVLWCKTFESPGLTQFPYTLYQKDSGDFYIFANVIQNTTNEDHKMVCRINASGNLVSTALYSDGYIWGGAIPTSDNGLLARNGSTLVKINSSGTVDWSIIYSDISEPYFKPIEVSDGYVFCGLSRISNQLSLLKIDLQGNILNGGRKEINFFGYPSQFVKNKMAT